MVACPHVQVCCTHLFLVMPPHNTWHSSGRVVGLWMHLVVAVWCPPQLHLTRWCLEVYSQLAKCGRIGVLVAKWIVPLVAQTLGFWCMCWGGLARVRLGSLGFVAGVSFTLAVDVAEAARKNTNAARGRPSSASTMPMALGATKCSSTLSVRALPRIFSAGSAGFIFFFFLLRRGGCRASCRLSRWLLLLPAWW